MDDDLSIVNNSLPESGVLTISHGSSASFNLKLRPRAIGQLTVTVSAVGDRGERDTVTKLLNVKVSVYLHQTRLKKEVDWAQFFGVHKFLVCHMHGVPTILCTCNFFSLLSLAVKDLK